MRTGNAELLMKGSLHTDELLAEVVKRETGFGRTGASAMCSLWMCPDIRTLCSLPMPR